MTTPVIRDVCESDRDQWEVLYKGYAEFYQVEQTDEMRSTVWSWLHEDRKESRGLVAEDATGLLIGLAHYRPFARPLSATIGCYLDDLYVSPAARGSGAADALISRVRAIATQENWSVVRWITAETNYRGRAVYDRLATKTNWITYDIKA
ncbi:MAG: GNAT family N-acetyltransferase [Pseudorhizobium sp.]